MSDRVGGLRLIVHFEDREIIGGLPVVAGQINDACEYS